MAPRRATRWSAAVAAVGLLLAACAGETSQPPEGIDLSTAVLSGPRSAPLGETSFLAALPVGTRQARWVEIDSQVCVRSMVAGETDKVCAPFGSDAEIDLGALAWSGDGSTLLFNEKIFQLQQETNVWGLTIATGELVNLADDRNSLISDDLSLRDGTPFVSDDGVVHYFQFSADSTTLWARDDNGTGRQLLLELPWVLPIQGVHRVGPDQFLIPTVIPGEIGAPLLLLDLNGPMIRDFTVPGLETPIVVASGPHAVVLADRGLWATQQTPYVLVQLDLTPTNDAATPVETTVLIHLDPNVEPPPFPQIGYPRIVPRTGRHSFAMSPDGTGFVVAYRPSLDQNYELLGFTWQANGQLSEALVIAPAGFLGTDESGEARGINSSPTFQSMVWTDDDQLLILTGDEALLFQLTSGL